MVLYACAADVGVVVDESADDDGADGDQAIVYLAALPDGPMQVLNGVGSLIWLEAVTTEGDGELVDRVAALVDLPPETIRDDVESFVDQLVNAGYLERLEGRRGQ